MAFALIGVAQLVHPAIAAISRSAAEVGASP
jgi:hypothetical protein